MNYTNLGFFGICINHNHNRAAVVLTLDSEQRRDQILKKARERSADKSIPKEEKYKYYFTERPKRSRSQYQTNSDDEVQNVREETEGSKTNQPSKNDKVKKLKNKYLQLTTAAEKRKKENKKKYGTPKAGTSQRAEKEEPEKTGPTNAASTPVVGLNSDTPIETLTTLVQEISNIVPVPNIDRMDMGMQVEVGNDHYVSVEMLDNTTVPYHEDLVTENDDREECIKKEIELV